MVEAFVLRVIVLLKSKCKKKIFHPDSDTKSFGEGGVSLFELLLGEIIHELFTHSINENFLL